MKKFKSWFSNLKFRTKILSICLLASLLPVITLGGFGYYQIQNLLITRESEVLDESLHQALSNLDYKVNSYLNVINNIVWNEDIKVGVTATYKNNHEMYLFYRDILDPLIDTSQFLHSDIRKITIYSDNIMHPHGSALRPLADIQQNSWFGSILETATPKLIASATDRSFLIASQIFDRQYNNTNIVYMDINYDKVFETASNIFEENYGLILLNENNQPVYVFNQFTENNMAYSLTDDQLLVKLNNGTLDDKYIYKKEYLPFYNWTAYIYRPLGTVYDFTHPIRFTFTIVVYLCILILFLPIYFLSEVVVRPLLMLAKNMEQIERGDLSVTVTTTATDEIGSLIQKFGNMVHKLQDMINEVYKSKIAKQEYEMKALQAQINPHFFYNSLSLINSKAIIADQGDISEMAQLLSTFYRTTLNRGKNNISVSDELENTTSYIQIQRMMHTNSFDVHYQIEEEILKYSMINLLLQPLVENAINHGIDHKETPGRGVLTIIGKQAGDDLIFKVSDNGCGIEKQTMDTLLTSKTQGYGVQNVHLRVQLTYGPEYGLFYESSIMEGTTVILTIPKRLD
ncbi:sensor histidine kinase [Sporosarcina sp. BP05]|uniref:cache domain-containing sensor histidine kinase n=1 Tax=Sporosarcina sp. BP05 TaxID=2758726 RepID=UPI00164560D1|nr:histidine kinase [Sporosarcina sp. BP05]